MEIRTTKQIVGDFVSDKTEVQKAQDDLEKREVSESEPVSNVVKDMKVYCPSLFLNSREPHKVKYSRKIERFFLFVFLVLWKVKNWFEEKRLWRQWKFRVALYNLFKLLKQKNLQKIVEEELKIFYDENYWGKIVGTEKTKLGKRTLSFAEKEYRDPGINIFVLPPFRRMSEPRTTKQMTDDLVANSENFQKLGPKKIGSLDPNIQQYNKYDDELEKTLGKDIKEKVKNDTLEYLRILDKEKISHNPFKRTEEEVKKLRKIIEDRNNLKDIEE